jgi:hypothetical protein
MMSGMKVAIFATETHCPRQPVLANDLRDDVGFNGGQT